MSERVDPEIMTPITLPGGDTGAETFLPTWTDLHPIATLALASAAAIVSVYALFKLAETLIGWLAPPAWVGKYYLMQQIRRRGIPLAKIPPEIVEHYVFDAIVIARQFGRAPLSRKLLVEQLDRDAVEIVALLNA